MSFLFKIIISILTIIVIGICEYKIINDCDNKDEKDKKNRKNKKNDNK